MSPEGSFISNMSITVLDARSMLLYIVQNQAHSICSNRATHFNFFEPRFIMIHCTKHEFFY